MSKELTLTSAINIRQQRRILSFQQTSKVPYTHIMSTHTHTSTHDRALSSYVYLFTPNDDNTNTVRKRVKERTLQRTTKCINDCVTCPFINQESVVISNSTGTAFGVVNHATHDCNTKGVIYLIECRECHFQYVGLTKQKLKQRLSQHRYVIGKNGQTLVAKHFSQTHHTLANLTIRVLQQVGSDKKTLHNIEDFWIRALNTAYPLGMNEKVRACHDLINAKTYDGISGTPYLQMKGHRKQTTRGKRRKEKRIVEVDEVIERIRYLLASDVMYRVLQYLRSLPYRFLQKLRKAVADRTLDYELRIIAAFTSGLINTKPIDKRKEPQITVIAQYVNHGLSSVLYDNIFARRELRRIIPDLNDIGVRIAYKREIPIGRKICNNSKILKNLTSAKLSEFYRNNCECLHSNYLYPPHGHVVSGDLNIVDDHHLRKIMGYGAKYRTPVPIDTVEVQRQTEEILIQFINKYKGDFRPNLPDFCGQFRYMIEQRIERLKNKNCAIFDNQLPDLQEKIRVLQRKYIIAPADKAANNLVILCPKYYVQAVGNEMGVKMNSAGNIEINGNDVYKPTAHTHASLMEEHSKIATRYSTNIGLKNRVIPMINGIPKLHKTPYKMRFLAGARLSSMKNVSITAHKALKCLQTVFRNYCGKISDRGSRPNTFWSINNSTEAVRCLQKVPQITNLATFDFSTLFTALTHSDIKYNLNWLISKMFDGPGEGMFMAIGRDKAYFTKQRSGIILDKLDTMLLMSDVIDNAFVTFAGVILRQSKGVPMGGNASPMMADLCLTIMEHRFMMSAQFTIQRSLRFVIRYIDDILVANCEDFANIATQIYPAALILNRADEPTDSKVAFLDLHIRRTGKLRIDLYDKTRDFNFSVVKFADITSNVPRNSTYQIFYGQLVRIARIITNETDWEIRVKELVKACLSVGANKEKLTKKFSQFGYNHQNLLWKYDIYTDSERKAHVLNVIPP